MTGTDMKTLLDDVEQTGDPRMDLTSTEIVFYRHIARQGPLRVEELLDCAEADHPVRALDRLVSVGLVRRLGTGVVAAVDPARVSDRLLEKWQQRAHSAQLDLLWMRSQIAELGLIYATQRHPAEGPQLERITSPDEVVRTLNRYADTSDEEVLTAQPGPAAEPAVAWHPSLRLRDRGVRLRTLYQYAVRFVPEAARFVDEATAAGAEARTVTGDLARFVVFDRKALVVPLRDGSDGVLVVRNEDLIASATEMFNAFWLTGDRLGGHREETFVQDLAHRTKRSILQHLLDGADDRATARALGISVRTCQRHVSEMMRQLGATSRFQLGYLCRERGLPGDGPLSP
ncbi:LuxR C-terminal-related transcriptional regulator [Streptomyces sp. NPDC014894]|uniref:LuxR C-terminal-related transcriptional regulator n=1 Tax=unclassified Streptomyces TaxID=2593676 RepID=UPI003702E1D2